MRLAANTRPSIRTAADVLTYAVNHGLAFQIGIKAESFAKFHPRQLSTMERQTVKHYYTAGYLDEPFSLSGRQPFVLTYRARMLDLLGRPHAPAYVGLGGPYSWVARRYGGVELAHKYMSGPSIQVTRHSRGENDSDERFFLGIHWDEVSLREKQLLLGYVQGSNGGADRWMYPPPEVLKGACHHWSGIWTSTMEDMFQYITKSVDNGTATPKSKSKWLHDVFRPFNTCRPPYHLSEENVTEIRLLCEFYQVPTNWDRVAISSLSIPEWREI
ncbi:hypothetical protein GALMADRAFT_65892 [Galerina marginata CBS 339.88]|uniref:Uncharacterized protein n=1 Tax=Galerina marginata (strain CBS 339.88) TaxID=685588 RepID=A0A067TBX8_GALM3|nr:hypothetical protein GALMADRAFT_65892 [Galerina marginata CBS 339.88]